MTTSTATTFPPAADLPPELTRQLNGHLNEQTILAWAELDLDAQNHFARSFAVLTPRQLIVLDGSVRKTELDEVAEAKIIEGVGMDRLAVRMRGDTIQLRYSRKYRRDMVKLNRKLGRLIPDPDAKRENRPEWLDRVEQQAEASTMTCGTCGQPVPAYANGVCPNCAQSRSVLWRLMGVAKPYRPMLLVALVLTLIHAGFAAAPGVVQKHLVDDGIANGTLPKDARLSNLYFWGGMFAFVILMSELIGGCRMAIISIVGTKVTRDLRHDVYAHLHKLSMRFYAKRRSGSLITRVTNDTDRLWDFIVFGSVNVVRDVLMICVSVLIMCYYNWRLAFISLLPLPVIAVVAWWRGRRMHAEWGHLWTYWARISAVVGDAIGGVRVVKAFAGEKRETERFDERNELFTNKEQQVNKIWWQLQPAVSAITRLSLLLVWVIGGYLVIRDWGIENSPNQLGTLLAFTFYVQMFFGPIGSLSDSARMVTRAATSAQRVFEVLDTPPEIFSKKDAITLPDVQGRIEFRNVGFSYEGAQPALRDVNLTVEPGRMVGLCGHSGAGKSTIVNLLCRFYDVTDGQILLDGRDVRDYDVQWLRQQIGVVLQEPYLFHGTIGENIRYGRPDASDREVIEAARAANAHDFIVGFPDGYDTTVGERGQSLSGGERQRVSIARAILHNPKVLVLDEATSSLDTETERQIQEAMNRLVVGRTTIAIAHRLSTLQAADKLVVLEKGRVAEEGTHSELRDKPDGVYAKLYRTQMEMNQKIAIN
ncbi:MAG TPA: ABC transporter ATP-binding protein [Tepidisphaeraceae bacterium]|jgi:ATP-binding cassette subfamily B protein